MTASDFLNDTLPLKDIPKTRHTGKEVVAGYPVNKYGYFSKGFERKDLNILFLGDSYTQGFGVKAPFGDHVCEMISEKYGKSVANWNMGIGGESCDYMARTLLCVVDYLKPDIVFLVFTALDRREYFRADGKKIWHSIDWVFEKESNGTHWQEISLADRELISNMNELISPFDDKVNFIKNYKIMECILNIREIPWGFSMLPAERIVNPILEFMDIGWVDKTKYVGTPFKRFIDSARLGHPGTESHKRFGEIVFEWLELNYSDRMG